MRRASFEEPDQGGGCPGIATPYRGPADGGAGYAGTLRVLAEHPQMTAVFAANDVMAIGALGAARELGLDVPGRLSVVGYDNTALAQSRIIDLTTVDDDSFGVGRESGPTVARAHGAEGARRRAAHPGAVARRPRDDRAAALTPGTRTANRLASAPIMSV